MKKKHISNKISTNGINKLMIYVYGILCILNSIALIYILYYLYNINKMITLSKSIRAFYGNRMKNSNTNFILDESYKKNFNIAVIGYIDKGKNNFIKFITNNNDIDSNTKNNSLTPYSIKRNNLTDVLIWDLPANKFENKSYYEKMNLGKFDMIVIFPNWKETCYVSIVHELQKNNDLHHIIFDVSKEMESAIDTNSKKGVVIDVTNYVKKLSIGNFYIIDNIASKQKKVYEGILNEIRSNKIKNTKTIDQSSCVIS